MKMKFFVLSGPASSGGLPLLYIKNPKNSKKTTVIF
jgi:hypothetical protein